MLHALARVCGCVHAHERMNLRLQNIDYMSCPDLLSCIILDLRLQGALMNLEACKPNNPHQTSHQSGGGVGDLVEINSGGQVLFCFFTPSTPTHAESSPRTFFSRGSPKHRRGREHCLVVKFHGSRLTTQSELFANELTRHLGVHAPSCRILRKVVGAPALVYGQICGLVCQTRRLLGLGPAGLQAATQRVRGVRTCTLWQTYLRTTSATCSVSSHAFRLLVSQKPCISKM